MIFDFLKDLGNYDQRLVANTKINGFIIDTVYTSDEGYETAICDRDGVYPVERYRGLELAKEGHKKWIEWMKNKGNKRRIKIKKLGGFNGMVKDCEIILQKIND